MNIIDKTDEEILAVAHPMWDDLVKFSNNSNYGAFTRHFSKEFLRGANEVEMGKQFARSELTKGLVKGPEYLGMIRRGEYVTIIYKQLNSKKEGEYLGRLVLGYEKDEIKIFGATIFQFVMDNIIQESKYVELIYKVVDSKTGNVFSKIEYPVGYVHGANDVLGQQVLAELEGREEGDVIEIKIDVDKLYGPRDESLVFIDKIENVPEEYRTIGTKVVMENTDGNTKEFLVTKVDDKTVTIDGNNPLCGRDVKFVLEVMLIREATIEEMEAGGTTDSEPSLDEILENATKH